MANILEIDNEKCTGCRVCEMVCSIKHDNVVNPLRSRIRIIKSEWQGRYTPVTCRQCKSPRCLSACPVNAISRDETSNRVVIDYKLCTGCRKCITACPFGALGFDPVDKKVIKCDLCDGDPQCVRFCETEAIRYVEAPDTKPGGNPASVNEATTIPDFAGEDSLN